MFPSTLIGATNTPNMPEDDQVPGYLAVLPTEILLHIFTLLSGRKLIKCREVCLRWRDIVDELTRSDALWREHCIKDFDKVYQVARYKARAGLLWFHVYRSLSLWPRLSQAREVRDEFAYASSVQDEVRNFVILQNGIIGIHKRSNIVYYDLERLELSKRGAVSGDYLYYNENEHAIVVASYYLHLFILRKIFHDPSYESNKTIDNVTHHILVNDEVYYVNSRKEIYVCKLQDRDLHSTLITNCIEPIVSLGYSHNRLNILTFERNIYTVIDDKLVLVCWLDECPHYLHQMYRYNLLEQLNWKVFMQWLCRLGRSIPSGPLREIKVVRMYGDIVFVGCNFGVLLIYNAPFTDGEFDFYNVKPVKQFNFMERADCPVLGMCPIIAVDVLESEHGHTVIVGMPKKIAVIDFVHVFKRTSSVAMLPYSGGQKVKALKTEESV